MDCMLHIIKNCIPRWQDLLGVIHLEMNKALVSPNTVNMEYFVYIYFCKVGLNSLCIFLKFYELVLSLRNNIGDRTFKKNLFLNFKYPQNKL